MAAMAAVETVAGDADPLTLEHRPSSRDPSSGGGGGQITGAFGRDVAQSRLHDRLLRWKIPSRPSSREVC